MRAVKSTGPRSSDPAARMPMAAVPARWKQARERLADQDFAASCSQISLRRMNHGVNGAL